MPIYVDDFDGLPGWEQLPKLPVTLLIDSSKAMFPYLGQLNEGLKHFFQKIKGDIYAEERIELSIIASSSEEKSVRGFASITDCDFFQLNQYDLGEKSFLGKSLTNATEYLKTRKKYYKENGFEYYQPWLVIITASDSSDSIEEIQKVINELEEQKRLAVFIFTLGNQVNKEEIVKFSYKKRLLSIKENQITKCFEWLAESFIIVAHSAVGQSVVLPHDNITEWAIIENIDEKPKKPEANDEELYEDIACRLPTCFIVNSSKSLLRKVDEDKTYLDYINLGLKKYFQDLSQLEEYYGGSDIAIITCNNEVKIVEDFQLAKDKKEIFQLQQSDLGEEMDLASGIKKGLELIATRKERYKEAGANYTMPCLVIFTDGEISNSERLSEVKKECEELQKQWKLHILILTLEQDMSNEVLNCFYQTKPKLLSKEKYDEYFDWVLARD